MRVLWVTNIATAGAVSLRAKEENPFGGWLQGSLESLAIFPDMELIIASPGTQAVQVLGSVGRVTYVGFPDISRRDVDGRGRESARVLVASQAPDLVHIHGTELAQAASFVSAAETFSIPSVVSIQGLVSVYARHMGAFLPSSVIHNPGKRPWIRSERVAGLRKSFELQGEIERRVLRSVPDVIGRTTWDRACALQIGEQLRYHHCDETLRRPFYSDSWQLENMRPYSIFVAQGHYPIKGLHLLLESLPTVISQFPGTLLTVAGKSPLAGKRTAYGNYLARLIDDLGLLEHVRFVGQQDERQMISHYLAANVIVCPSVIENSPNSVAEAMLLGAPVVAAHVGGVPDIVKSGVDGVTYQADAPYMLSHAVSTLFADPDHAARLGDEARRTALVRHDPKANAARTREIYSAILDER